MRTLNLLDNVNLEKQIIKLFTESGLKKFLNIRYNKNKVFTDGILAYYILHYCDYLLKTYGIINEDSINKDSQYFLNNISKFAILKQEIYKTDFAVQNVINMYLDEYKKHKVAIPKKLQKGFVQIFFDELLRTKLLYYIVNSYTDDTETGAAINTIYDKWLHYLDDNQPNTYFADGISDFVVFYYLTKQYFNNLESKLN